MFEMRDEIRRLFARDACARVTLVRPGALGDTILLLPTVQRLHDAAASLQLTVVGSAWAELLLPLLPTPWEFVHFGSPQLTRLFDDGACGVAPSALADSELIVIYTSEPGSVFVRNARRLCQGTVIAWPASPPAGLHAACHFAAALAAEAPGEAQLPTPRLRVREGVRREAKRRIDTSFGTDRGALVAVHAGSGGARKCWPPKRFARLIEAMRTRGARAVLLRGPADAEPTEAVLAHLRCRDSPTVVEPASIEQMAALISCADAFLGNDSGVTHLAAALGVPTLAVFGPTDPALWRPLGRCVTVVRSARTRSNPSAWPAVKQVLAGVCGMLHE